MAEQHTFSDLRSRAGQRFDERLVSAFGPEEELEFEVRLPDRAGAGGSGPCGVFIYISPKPGAKPPPAWAAVLDEHNLVWVGAQNSGNEVDVVRRVGLALLAPAVADQVADINLSQMILSGFSGGGRVASMMMPAYPDLYSGALFFCGANPLMVVADSVVQRLTPVPMVFLTGTGDFNYEDTHMAFATYRQAGLARAELMVVEDMGHELPGAEAFSTAVGSLVRDVSGG